MDPGLDFASLLGIAEHVSKDKAANGPQLMKTKFAGPKKEKREKGKLNVNVQKFLLKKEAEERAAKLEKKRQVKDLQEKRTDAQKNKIIKHLKVTKSSNKAVLSEAVNVKDTAITLNGRTQCDEDDYGFESGVSNKLYEKLMGKYEASPEDPMAKFSKAKPKTAVDIKSAKERIKQALRQEEIEATQPRKRKRKHGSGGREPDEPGVNYTREGKTDGKKEERREERKEDKKEERKSKSQRDREREEAAEKRRQNAKKAPKPMDFESLMAVAKNVKDQPVQVVKKEKKEIKEHEIGDRPMTKRQKEEWRIENERRLRREGKLPKESTPPTSKKSSSDKRETDRPKSSSVEAQKIPKIRKPDPGPELHSAVRKSMPPMPRKSDVPARKPEVNRRDDRRQSGSSGRNGDASSIKLQEEYKRMQEKCKEMEEKLKLQEKHKKLQDKMKEMEEQMKKVSSSTSREDSSRSKGSLKGSSDNRKRDIRDVQPRHFPGEKQRKKEKEPSRGGRQRIESDSEYDSEMDDFIDDEDGGVDISKEIRSIFGYDRSRYRDEPDFDDRSMENNRYSSIMQEEVRSARIGRQEDLEDIRREEAEKKRKKMKTKGR